MNNSDFSLISHTQKQVNLTRWGAFMLYMEGKGYKKHDALTAWSHFRAGWDARENIS